MQHVIVAAPPVLTTITASVVSDYADAVLLVISAGHDGRRDLGHAADNLRATGAPLTGAVLSETSLHRYRLQRQRPQTISHSQKRRTR